MTEKMEHSICDCCCSDQMFWTDKARSRSKCMSCEAEYAFGIEITKERFREDGSFEVISREFYPAYP